MPLYQVQSRVNSQTVSTDMECSHKDDALSLYSAVSVGEVLEVREYLYTNKSSVVVKDENKSRFCSIKVYFKNSPMIVIKIPSLKQNKNELDIKSHIHNLYSNAIRIDVKITSPY